MAPSHKGDVAVPVPVAVGAGVAATSWRGCVGVLLDAGWNGAALAERRGAGVGKDLPCNMVLWGF